MSDKEFDVGGNDFDEFNFDDFDPSIDELGGEEDRTPIGRIKQAALEGFEDISTDTGLQRNLRANMLPEGYRAGTEVVADAAYDVSRMYEQAKKDAAPAVKEFKKASNKLLANNKSLLPESLYNKLNQLTTVNETSGAGDADENRISNEVGALTTALAEIQTANAAQASASDEESREVGKVQHKESMVSLGNLGTKLDRTIAFNEKIAGTYYQKNLDLQYRQYFAQRDLLEVTKRANTDIINNLGIIAKNSSLPDVIKMRSGEHLNQMLEASMFGGLTEKASDFSTNFRSKVLKNIEGRVRTAGDAVTTALGGLNQGIGMANQMQESGMAGPIDPLKMGVKSLLGIGAKRVGVGLTNKIREALLNDPNIEMSDAQLTAGLSQLDTFIPYLIERNKGRNKVLDKVLEQAQQLMPSNTDYTQRIGHNLATNANDAVAYSILDRRSLTEIIPELLSMQLHELRIGNGLDPNSPRLTWNAHREAFTSTTSLRNDVLRKTVAKSDSVASKARLDAATKSLLGDKIDEYTDEEKETLQRQFLAMAGNGTHFNLENLFNKGNYENATPATKAMLEKLEKQFSGHSDRLRGERAMGSASVNAKSALPDIEKALRREVGLGNKDALRAAGIIYTDENGVDQVNKKALINDIFGDEYFNRKDGRGFDAGYEASPGTTFNQPRGPSGAVPKGQRGFATVSVGAAPASESITSKDLSRLLGIKDDTEQMVDSLRRLTGEGLGGNDANNRLTDIGSRLDTSNEHLANIHNILTSGVVVASGTGTIALSPEDLAKIIPNTSMFGNVLDATFKGSKRLLGAAGDLGASYFKGAKELGLTGWQGAKRGVADTWDTLTDKVRNSDIYVAGANRVAITKRQLESGTLIDELTGKVISSINDITGPVKDAEGNFVISPEEWAKGLVNGENQSLLGRGINWMATKPAEFLGSYYNIAFNTIPKAAKDLAVGALQQLNPIRDIYVKGDDRPKLLASILKSGGYRNTDGSIVGSIDDIKGDVHDIENNIALSVEDLKLGLVDVNGNEIRSQNVMSIVGDLAGSALRFGVNTIRGVGRSVANVYKRIFGVGDHEGKGLLEGLRGFFTSKVSLMRVSADTVIIEGSTIQTGDLNRGNGETMEAYASRLNKAASEVKSSVSAKAASVKEQGEKAFDAAKVRGEEYYQNLAARGDSLYEEARIRAEKAENEIRESIEDPEGLYQTTKAKGQSRLDEMVESLKVLKDEAVSRGEELRKKVSGDANGDGVREGNFRDRLAAVKDRLNPFGGGGEDTDRKGKPVEEKQGMLSKLMDMLGGVGGFGGMMGIAGMLPKLLAMGGLASMASKAEAGTGEDSGEKHLFGIDPTKAAMGAGAAAILAPRLTWGAAKGAGKLTMGLAKGLGKTGGFIAKNGIKGAIGALVRLPGFAGALTRVGLAALGPVGWAVTGGMAAYKAYKFAERRAEVELLEGLRFAHYGFHSREKDKIVQIRYLEDNLIGDVEYNAKGVAVIKRDLESIVDEFASDFGVNVENEAELQSFVVWFVQRFVPAFCKQLEVLNQINPRTDLLDIDDELPDHDKIKFATGIWLKTAGQYQPYEIASSPFPGHVLMTGTTHISALVNEIRAAFSVAVEKHKALEAAPKPEMSETIARRSAGTGYAISATTMGTKAYGPMSTTPRPRAKPTPMPIGDLKADTSLLKGTSLEDKPLGTIESLRMHYYGLDNVSGDQLYSIRALENFVATKINNTGWFSSKTDPSLDTDDDECWDKFALLFGWNPEDRAGKRQWALWFNRRFTPIFLLHQGVLASIDSTKTLLDVDSLGGVAKVEFLRGFLVQGRNKPENVKASPFPGEEITITMKAIFEGLVAVRRAFRTRKKVEGDPVAKAIADSKAVKRDTPHADSSDVVNPTQTNRLLEDNKGNMSGKEVLKTASFIRGGGFKGGIESGFAKENHKQYSPANGATVEPWTGKGKIDERMRQFGGIIAEMSDKYGVPQSLIRAIIQQESAANPNARSPVGAMGLMQLMPATAKELGLTNAFDPKQNIEGGTKYIARQLRWANGNVPEALAGYNGGRAYVLDAKRIAREELGREPTTKEMLDRLPQASIVRNGKRYTPDYKQMWDYVNKIVPNYASRSGKNVATIMGGEAFNASKIVSTKSGVTLPTNNAVNTRSVSSVVPNGPSKDITSTPSKLSSASALAAQQASYKASEARHREVTQRRQSEERLLQEGKTFGVLQDQLSVLREIRDSLSTVAPAMMQTVETKTPTVSKPVPNKEAMFSRDKSYAGPNSSVNMG